MKNNAKINNEMYKEEIVQNAKKRYLNDINNELERKQHAE